MLLNFGILSDTFKSAQPNYNKTNCVDLENSVKVNVQEENAHQTFMDK